jgi:hypothetical protein
MAAVESIQARLIGTCGSVSVAVTLNKVEPRVFAQEPSTSTSVSFCKISIQLAQQIIGIFAV